LIALNINKPIDEVRKAIMEKRNKAEQFRKARNNFFKRGYQIGINSDTKMFIWMERKDKLYTFANMSLTSCVCKAKVRDITI